MKRGQTERLPKLWWLGCGSTNLGGEQMKQDNSAHDSKLRVRLWVTFGAAAVSFSKRLLEHLSLRPRIYFVHSRRECATSNQREKSTRTPPHDSFQRDSLNLNVPVVHGLCRRAVQIAKGFEDKTRRPSRRTKSRQDERTKRPSLRGAGGQQNANVRSKK